nr:hypothetical protein CFP56_37267 [Quercus suber]
MQRCIGAAMLIANPSISCLDHHSPLFSRGTPSGLYCSSVQSGWKARPETQIQCPSLCTSQGPLSPCA